MDCKNNYILSIEIPTYYSAELLKQNLSLLVEESGFDKVQLVISDNASPDETETVVREFQKNHPNIKYHRNQENIGLEANTKKVIELSDGEYIKLLNDYTSIEKGKLNLLIRYIEQNKEQKPNLFFLNNSGVSNCLECDSLNRFIEIVSYWSTWLSCFGIWKSDYEAIENKDIHFGFLFYQTSILFEVVSRKKTVIIQDKLFISFDLKNKGGYSLLVFLDNYFLFLVKKHYEQGSISKAVYRKEKKALLKFLYPYITGATIKKNNSFDKKGLFRKIIASYKTNIYFYPYVFRYLAVFVIYHIFKRLKDVGD
jgi:glycosyltransferase involved in cell wall biosynthesis